MLANLLLPEPLGNFQCACCLRNDDFGWVWQAFYVKAVMELSKASNINIYLKAILIKPFYSIFLFTPPSLWAMAMVIICLVLTWIYRFRLPKSSGTNYAKICFSLYTSLWGEHTKCAWVLSAEPVDCSIYSLRCLISPHHSSNISSNLLIHE